MLRVSAPSFFVLLLFEIFTILREGAMIIHYESLIFNSNLIIYCKLSESNSFDVNGNGKR